MNLHCLYLLWAFIALSGLLHISLGQRRRSGRFNSALPARYRSPSTVATAGRSLADSPLITLTMPV